MKAHHLYLIFLLMVFAMYFDGCKFDVDQPLWETTNFVVPTNPPKINSITPVAVVPGVNTITITGENLASVRDSSVIIENSSIHGYIPTIIEKTATKIVIRRPNLSNDSCIVKLVPDSGFVVRSSIFSVKPVIEEFGSFLDNITLTSGTIDNSGNLYVTYGDSVSAKVFKISPAGDKVLLGKTTRIPSGAAISSDGWLYFLSAGRLIERMNTLTGEVFQSHKLKTSKPLKYGDMDANGYLYAGGARSDLWVIAPDSTSTDRSDLYGSTDEIQAIHVSNGYLYVAARNVAGGPTAIYRYIINTGTLGNKELVLDLASSNFGSLVVTDFSIAEDGRIFIAAGSSSPFLVFDPSSGQTDEFYLDIIPTYCRQITWGDGNIVYVICGNTNTTDATQAQSWRVYKVDLGVKKAAGFGG